MTADVAAIFILLLYLHKCQHMSSMLHHNQLVSASIFNVKGERTPRKEKTRFAITQFGVFSKARGVFGPTTCVSFKPGR